MKLMPVNLRLFALAIICAILYVSVAVADKFVLPPDDQYMIGVVREITVGRDTTLSDEARRYNVGFNEIRLANPWIDPWLPENGSKVILPTQHLIPDVPRKGIVLNVPEMRLYYFPKPERNSPPVVITNPVSIGRGDWETPLGQTKVIAKTTDPVWRPPESIRNEHAAEGDILPKVVPAGPENPLGKHALRLGLPGYLIHGTNKPYGIGMQVTHGCVRMYPEDIEAIYDLVPVGTPVNIVQQPYKFGWYLDMLYLEAHPPFRGDNSTAPDIKSLYDAVRKINEKLAPGQKVDWDDALRIARNPAGMPVPVKVIQNENGPA